MRSSLDLDNDEDSHGGGYKPSPYPVSILPKVHLSKPRPNVRTADVPPTPLLGCDGDVECDRNYRRSDDDLVVHVHDGGERCVAKGGDKSIKLASDAASAEVASNNNMTTRIKIKRRSRNSNDEPSAASKNSNKISPPVSKIIEVISTTNSHQSESQNNNEGDETTASKRVCTTCHKHEARYTCPKCKSPYCSVSCYGIHDGSVDNSNNIKVCTESFYKDRVLGLSNVIDNGNPKQLRGVLARMHRDINDNLDGVEKREESISHLLEDTDEDGIVNNMRSDVMLNSSADRSSVMQIDKQSSVQIISDEDLAELAEYVLQMEDDGFDDDEHGKGLLESIPPHLLHAFECALASATGEASDESPSELPKEASGEDTKKALEDAWAPFIGGNETKEQNNENHALENNETECPITRKQFTLWWLPGEGEEADGDISDMIPSFSGPTLDDRIVALPPLPKLCTSSNHPNTLLSYNILEVLYAASFVTRAKSNSSTVNTADSGHSIQEVNTAIDDAALLLSQSQVLSNDARYSSVQEVMMESAERLVENKKTMPTSTPKIISPIDERQGRVISWNILALDVAILSYHRRYVLRMLFDALDVCQSGLDGIKSQLKEIKKSNREDETSKRECEDSKRRYKLATKKVEYFLSWCSTMWTVELGNDLSEDVRAFVADWLKEDAQVEESSSAVEQLIRGIHAIDTSGGDDGNGLLAGGILDLGGNTNSSVHLLMEEQMVSISTVRKK